ncbi:MAG TPA: hypothetical protein VLA72_16585, partial [Anaerolineales bacterium]|nr:hypothetical protein [Anaerolineales bacterium]
MNKKFANGLNSTFITLIVTAILVVFLSPFAFMIFTSLKTQGQISILGAPVWPAGQPKATYNDKEVEVFTVPMAQCEGFDSNSSETRSLAIVQKGRQESTFVDPDDLGRGEFVCQVSWRALDRPWELSPTWSNYAEVWDLIPNGY